MSEREREVDELLRDFQEACEIVGHTHPWDDTEAKKLRALLRNELRKQLLDASAAEARAVRCEGERDALQQRLDDDENDAMERHLFGDDKE